MRALKKKCIRLNRISSRSGFMFLFNSHSPYPSHPRPLRSTSQQHEGLRPPSARWFPPVKTQERAVSMASTGHLFLSTSVFLRWFILGDTGVYFSSQLPPIKSESRSHTGCCHTSSGCYLASYQRVISSTSRCGSPSYLKSSAQDAFI